MNLKTKKSLKCLRGLFIPFQPAFTSSNSTIETPEQCLKSAQS